MSRSASIVLRAAPIDSRSAWIERRSPLSTLVRQGAEARPRLPIARGGLQLLLPTAKDDRAMASVFAADPAAELGQILVGVDDAALDGLSRPCVVAAIIQRHPTAPKLVGPLQLRPGHAGSHAV